VELEPTASDSPEAPPPGTCLCGEEQLVTPCGRHIIGARCQILIQREVRHRFDYPRFGGRFSHAVEDIVQECYEKLSRPGGVGSFRPPPDRPAANAFRAWLRGVVRNHCNNKQKSLGIDLRGVALEQTPEPTHAKTPEQAFALECLLELAESAIAEVEARWRETGRGERFDVFLPFVLERDDDYARAEQRLGLEVNHLRQLKHKLTLDIRHAARARQRDELFLEPGLSLESIEAKIDQSLRDLLRDAFPDTDRQTLNFPWLEQAPAPPESRTPDGAPPEETP
jgi:hypothetical protein